MKEDNESLNEWGKQQWEKASLQFLFLFSFIIRKKKQNKGNIKKRLKYDQLYQIFTITQKLLCENINFLFLERKTNKQKSMRRKVPLPKGG